jgi:DNA ligase-associated metallophosphoesterase
VRRRKEASSFSEEKEAKRLLFITEAALADGPRPGIHFRWPQGRSHKSLFASFSSEKEGSFLPDTSPALARDVTGSFAAPKARATLPFMIDITLSGERFVLDSAGALFWPGAGLLAVADLHLEKGSACARRGNLVPPWDSRVTVRRLAEVVGRYAPRVLVSVGDAFHDSAAAGRLDEAEARALRGLGESTRMIWVCGNHDPCAPVGVGGETMEAFTLGPITFRHEARAGAHGEISGHFHPKARVATRAGTVTRPCFIADAARLILPSFGAYTGGLDIASAAIARLFPAGAEAFLLGRDKLFRFAVEPPPAPRRRAPSVASPA